MSQGKSLFGQEINLGLGESIDQFYKQMRKFCEEMGLPVAEDPEGILAMDGRRQLWVIDLPEDKHIMLMGYRQETP